ncbi:Catechol 2,3-dioxygenase [Sinosporangium album]|uniref:Catechol 2,3-dioxygenase n=1 Tax=Sinosporangium album TaxID=504805 RepID=A0A1G8KE98_9ACTN|nr:VOC family protein [Sinosporangium album]SDI41729.1 Catechol 2,3-dioxygenase [Sinosporangium album]
MKFHSPMIVVADIDRSKRFYVDVLHEEIEQDLGVYVVLKGGFSLMAQEQWKALTGDDAALGKEVGHRFELYFEEDDLERFVEELTRVPGIKSFTDLTETSWGQRALRFFDPDGHVIEVAESMEAVVRRMLATGEPAEEVSRKSMMPLSFVQERAAEVEAGR